MSNQMNFAIWPIASPIQSLLTYFVFFFWGSPHFVFLLFSFSSRSPVPSPTAHSESALTGDRLAHASLMTKSLGLWPSPCRWPQTSGTPLGEPHVCSPAWAARAEMRGGEWRCLSPGGRQSSFQEEAGVSFPRARSASPAWLPAWGLHPSPSRRSGTGRSPHTGTCRPWCRAPRRAAPQANCHGNRGVHSIPHPADPPSSLRCSQPACARPGSAL